MQTLSPVEQGKKLAGYKACDFIEDGMTIGLGTGSTAYYAIERTGELVAQGMKIKAVATSLATAELAKARNIELLNINQVQHLDLAIDGVDEIDPQFNAVKGGGGALFREKIVAKMSSKVIWVMDDRKLVDSLGAFPLPLEVLPFGSAAVLAKLTALGLKPRLRLRKDSELEEFNNPDLARQLKVLNSDEYQKLWLTDNGNILIDLLVGAPLDLDYLRKHFAEITGILETGLFLNMCERIYVGGASGVQELVNPNCPA